MAFTLFLITTINAICQTNVSGVLNENTVWRKSNSPYNIVGNVGVNSNVNLTIEAGVQINYTGNYEILVFGSLTANGIKNDEIKFNGYSIGGSGTKKMLEFRKTNLSNSSIKYANFKGGQDALLVSRESESEQEIIKVSGILNMENCNFINCIVQTSGYNSQGKLLIKNSNLNNVTVKGRYPRTEPIELYNCVIENSVLFSDAYNYGITVDKSIVNNTSFKIDCCGANFNIKNSRIANCNFESLNDSHEIKIDNSILINTVIQQNERDWYTSQKLSISNSIYVSNLDKTIYYQDIVLDKSILIGNVKSITAVQASSRLNIKDCHFLNWKLALKVQKDCNVSNSNFLNNVTLIEVSGNKDVIAGSNHWGDGDINSRIIDKNDDLNYGLVNLVPIIKNPIALVKPILPPTNLVLTKNSQGKFKLTWNLDANNLIEYRLYFEKKDPFSYNKFIEVGRPDQGVLLDATQASDFALTAIMKKDEYTNEELQLQGFESWYSTSFISIDDSNLSLAESNDASSFFSVYPNPVKNAFSIVNNSNSEITYYSVSDLSGRTISEGNNENLKTFKMSNCSRGVYILNLKLQNGDYSILKLIKD